MKKIVFITLILGHILKVVAQTFDQDNNLSAQKHAVITMPAGKQFSASKWKMFWWGKHWRTEWITPVTFVQLDLDTLAGGLTALQRGGGNQTKTLRLLAANGKEYVLRTIDKSLDILIPEEFKGSFINDMVNDQISMTHPYSALVIAHLSDDIGIMHTNPVIGFVSNNKRLGKFAGDFANTLCLFEERPSGKGWEHTMLTGDADEIINSEKLLEKLKEKNNKSVDQKEFLKVRLFDMLINDWDRHEDQWIWAGKKKDGQTIYYPFARDRDHAFSKTDGVYLYLLSRPWTLRALQNMDKNVNDVIGTNLAATRLDKRFTNELNESDWIDVITKLQNSLNDIVIQSALQRLPPDIYALSGDFLYQRLRSRRNRMMEYGMRYYRLLNKEVFIEGTNQAEIIHIKKNDDQTTHITIQALNDKNTPADTIYHRIFNDKITKYVNVYGGDGNDQFVDNINVVNRTMIRLMGGDGIDKLTNTNNEVNGNSRVYMYDTKSEGAAPVQTVHFYPTSDTSITQYQPKDFRYDWWKPLIVPGVNPDDGFVLGAGFTYKKMRWHKSPYDWQQTIGVKYAAATGAYSLMYKGHFKKVFGKWDLELDASYKAPSYVINFYGFGNETQLVTKEKSFYRIRATSLYVNPATSRTWKNNTVYAGLLLNSFRIEKADNKFINQVIPLIDSTIFETKYFAGANASYTFHKSNNVKNPTRGIHYEVGTSYQINLEASNRSFLNLHSNFAFYYSPVKNITLAHRTGGANNFGQYEFYQANTIGGMENLRGYWRSRFTGQTSFYQNTDLRWKIADVRGYVVRGALGMYAFFDDGRVWTKNETSHQLHTGYGGGIYFIPFNTLALNFSYGFSGEVNFFSFRTGFFF
jgi:hypothetical protein